METIFSIIIAMGILSITGLYSAYVLVTVDQDDYEDRRIYLEKQIRDLEYWIEYDAEKIERIKERQEEFREEKSELEAELEELTSTPDFVGDSDE